MDELAFNQPHSYSNSVQPFLPIFKSMQILTPEDQFQLESIEAQASEIVLTPITSGLLRVEVQDFMEDFKLEREEGSEWSEEPRKQRRDRMQMHKTPILQLFRLENDLDRIVEYDEQSYESQLWSEYSSFGEKHLNEDVCGINSNTFCSVWQKKEEAKDTCSKDISVFDQTTVEPSHVDYTETISKFNENPRAEILSKLKEVESLSSETDLFQKQNLIKKYLQNYLLQYETFCYEESWKELGKCMEDSFDLIREGIQETFNKNIGSLPFETRRVKLLKYLEKKRRRIWKKKVSYDCRKKVADGRLRIKGKFVTRQQACEQLGLESLDSYSPEQIKEMLQGRIDENLKQLSC